MRTAIEWTVKNSPFMNTLLGALLIVGAGALLTLKREVFPEFQLDLIVSTVVYPGASPSEVEEGICQKIEEAIRPIQGIKKVYAVAAEGTGSVIAELETSVDDPQKVLEEIRSSIDRIPSFPELAEDPHVRELTLRTPAINIAVAGGTAESPASEWELRELAEQIRNELLLLPSISQVDLISAKEYQIDVEIPERNLRKYGLTLQQVADIIRNENLEIPAGNIKTENAEYLVRGKNRQLVGARIAQLPVLSQPNGIVLTVADLGAVKDGFEDTTALTEIDGKLAQAMVVQKSENEDLLQITDDVHRYVRTRKMPPGFELKVWGDRSTMVRDRLALLTNNGIVGLILVFVILGLFLDLRLAFWVAIGIPVSILGTCIVMQYTGSTLNMLSMFAFVMGLGIVVDDAIVIGDNIYAHRQRNKSLVRAAIDGAAEVAPSVISSVLTTVIAFAPLLFVSGVMGKFLAVMPLAVIAMLLVSLVESIFVLPCHLAHEESTGWQNFSARIRGFLTSIPRQVWFGSAIAVSLVLGVSAFPVSSIAGITVPAAFGTVLAGVAGLGLVAFLVWCLLAVKNQIAAIFKFLRGPVEKYLHAFIDRIYIPILNWHLNNSALTYATAVSLLLLSMGLVAGGYAPFIVFPKMDSEFVRGQIAYPVGTPGQRTDEATKKLEETARALGEEYQKQGISIIKLIQRSVGQLSREAEFRNLTGSNVGEVFVELVPPEERTISSEEFIRRWRQLAGEFPGAQEVTFSSAEMAPSGAPIEFKLLGQDVDQLEEAVEVCKQRLASYPGVFDISDDSEPGKWELQIRIRPEAEAMGIQLDQLARTVRATYYGEEVMRLQRGRHEVKLMVRYPEEERRSLANFSEIRIRTPQGDEIPLPELAQVTVARGYSEINRIDQVRSITVTADVDEKLANAREIAGDLKSGFFPDLFKKYPGLSVRWEGQEERTNESVNSLFAGFIVALLAMFALLTAEFRSYLQPLMILVVIPFGMVGAIGGHLLMGLPLTMFSLFGMVALSGVVVNDSIVLIDFINHRHRDGIPLRESLLDAGRQRFRPVLLTSVTTVAGLLPIVLERSVQAQVLIPMAVSLSFGLMVSTLWVLILVPTMYQTWAYWFAPPEEELAFTHDENIEETALIATAD